MTSNLMLLFLIGMIAAGNTIAVQEVQAQQITNDTNNMTAMECAIADQSKMTPETRQDCLDKMIAGTGSK